MRRPLFRFLIITLACLYAVVSYADDLDIKIRQQQNLLRRIERQMSYQKKLISSYSKKEQSLLNQLRKLNQIIVKKNAEIRLIDLKIAKLDKSIKRLKKEINDLTAKVLNTRELLKERVVAMYKYGGVGRWQLLMSASNTVDLMNRFYFIRRLAQKDEEMIKMLQRDLELLRKKQAELSLRQKELSKQKEKLLKEKRYYYSQLKKRDKLLREIRNKRQFYEKAYKEFLKTQKELEENIKKLLAEKRKRQQAKTAKSVLLKKRITPPKYGRMLWPVKGRVVSPFGVREHPFFHTKVMHTGIDIKASYGTAVRAAATGDVLYAGWVKGYGQVVILDHGGGITTVYAHLSKILVDEGQRVRMGDIIGRVGRTGLATGSHLHFEVRVNGEAVNPMKYLSKR